MNEEQILKKIIEKKEFSELPLEDVKNAFNKFNKTKYLDEEKIKLTRDLLRKTYSVFLSKKLLIPRNKDFEWFLNKHISTKERFQDYTKIYKKIIGDFKEPISVYDLGCGINGFSYSYLQKLNQNVSYTGIEAINQLVKIQNQYFKEKGFDARILHESLFNLGKVKEILAKGKSKKIVFLFKVLDSLEMLERDFSKKLLLEILPFADLIVVSFATKSLISRKNFRVSRNWIISFIKENFEIKEDFQSLSERYLIFRKR